MSSRQAGGHSTAMGVRWIYYVGATVAKQHSYTIVGTIRLSPSKMDSMAVQDEKKLSRSYCRPEKEAARDRWHRKTPRFKIECRKESEPLRTFPYSEGSICRRPIHQEFATPLRAECWNHKDMVCLCKVEQESQPRCVDEVSLQKSEALLDTVEGSCLSALQLNDQQTYRQCGRKTCHRHTLCRQWVQSREERPHVESHDHSILLPHAGRLRSDRLVKHSDR